MKANAQMNNDSTNKDIKTIIIEDIEYKYLITKIENGEGISIKLTEAKPVKNIAFIYEASSEKIINDIKILYMYNTIEKKINILNDIFKNNEIKVEKKGEKYIMIIEVSLFGNKEKYEIEITKHEQVDEKTELLLKLKEMDIKYEEIKKELNRLKNQSNVILNKEDKKKLIKEIKEELNINEYIKEIINNKEIKDILFKEFEERLSNIYIKKGDNKLNNENIEESINKIIDNKYISNENKFNDNINKIKEDINKYIKDINEIKNNIINDNYITMKIKINKKDIGKDIIIINQCSTYKLFKNFELDDIEVEINEEKIPIKYKHYIPFPCYSDFYQYNTKLIDSSKSQKGYHELENNYSFYWNFSNEGIYNIKIIFKRQLSSCAGMFYECNNINEIDISKFDCTKILSCEYMFCNCSNLKKIGLGKLDFSLCKSFRSMFSNCYNLIDLDVTNFNTKNSKSFYCMFCRCGVLKKMDVSKFNSSKCENIRAMFQNCYSIEEIDMINWDMSNLKYKNKDQVNPIDNLFNGCKKLKRIKISGNINKEETNQNFKGNIFKGIPSNGELIMSKKVECNIPLDGYLPTTWTRIKE